MRFLFLFVSLLLITGCAGGPKIYKTQFEKGSILVLPARDVVQNGKPHKVGEGSGKLLTEKTVEDLTKLGFVATTGNVNDLSSLTVASKEEALAEANKVGADYYLQLSLGEFRNAAPMTFRTDFVTLEKALMVKTKTEETVWRLEKPILLEKSNLGNHLGLIDNLAKIVSNSIAKK